MRKLVQGIVFVAVMGLGASVWASPDVDIDPLSTTRVENDNWKQPTNPNLPRGQCIAPAEYLRVNECVMEQRTPFNYGKPVPHGARVTYVDEFGIHQGWMFVRCWHGELFIDTYDVTNCGARPTN